MGVAPDPRFFETLGPLGVSDLAALTGGEVFRDTGISVKRVAPLATAGPDGLGFLGDRKYSEALRASRAGCVIIPAFAVDAAPAEAAVIVSHSPQASWAAAALALHRPLALSTTHASEAMEDESVAIEPGVVVGQGVRIGRGTRIGANSVIGPGVQIGRDCVIGPNVSVGFALIGDRVILHPGCRIGQDGFGRCVAPAASPHRGRGIWLHTRGVSQCPCP
jgi:UDP-3-O-[3-hydroxymyristoyl] glucosamine N-acyltransferase